MTEHHHEGRPEHLHHHFDTEQQQFDSDKLGMWLFLVTEILLFGGLFVAYAYYRSHHPEVFLYAHKYLDKTLGGINTVVLIASSLTMAWAVRAAQLGRRRLLVLMLSLTLLGGLGFLGIKAIEYEHKWKHGLLWGQRYQPLHVEESEDGAAAEDGVAQHAAASTAEAAAEHESQVPDMAADRQAGEERSLSSDDGGHVPEELAVVAEPEGAPPADVTQQQPAASGPAGLAYLPGEAPATDADHLVEQPENVHLFFGIYFAMTGLHALHVIAGLIVITVILVLAVRGRFDGGYYTPVDLTGLYWHIVDLIWIFLFPLLYLIH